MAKEDIVSYSTTTSSGASRHEPLANLIADRGWANARLGVEMENYYYSARAHQVLSNHHAGKLQDSSLLVNWCRAVDPKRSWVHARRTYCRKYARHL